MTPTKPRSLVKPFVTLLCMGLLLTSLLTWWSHHNNQQWVAYAMGNTVEAATDNVTTRLRRYEHVLQGAGGLVQAVGRTDIRQLQFQQYMSSLNIDLEYPGARGFGLIQRVPQAQTPAFVQHMRTHAHEAYDVKQLSSNNGDRYLIQFIEPHVRNAQALGLDIASETTRRQAAETALRTGRTTLTGPITLLQTSGSHQQAVLLLYPIYNTETPSSNLTERMQQGVAWTYTALVLKDILGHAGINPEQGLLVIRDVTDSAKAIEIFKSAGLGPATYSNQQALRQTVYGREWEIILYTNEAYAQSTAPRPITTVVVTGTLVSLIIALGYGMWQRSRSRARQLAFAQAQLAGIVESSIDAIIGTTLQGEITSWNRGAEQMFGLAAQQALGHTLSDLLIPPAQTAEQLAMLKQVAQGQAFSNIQSQRKRVDGTTIDVALSISPLYNEVGQVMGTSETVRDISKEKRIENEIRTLNATLEQQVLERTHQLAETQHFLQKILDIAPAKISYWDERGANVFSNKASQDHFNRLGHFGHGLTMREMLGPERYDPSAHIFEACLRGEASSTVMATKGTDGTTHYNLLQCLPDIENGKIQGFFAVATDVTEVTQKRKELTQALQKNETLLQTISAQLLYSATDALGHITEVNDHFCQAHGYTREELLGQTHRLLSTGHVSAEQWGLIWQGLHQGQAWHGEVCNRAKDGSLRWFDTVIAPILDDSGMLQRCIALRLDNTQRKLADAELHRVHGLLDNVLKAASEVSIIATDTDGTITLFNEGAQRMLGYQASELVGISTPAPLHLIEEVVARGQALSQPYGQAIEGFRVFLHVPELQVAETREWTYVRKDGQHLTVSLSVTCMQSESGQILGYLGIATDITQRKHTEAALLQAKQAAEAASVAKGQFLANMSHEIRTPMNAVLGMLELLGQTALNHKQADYTTKAQTAAKSLLGLLNDILDYSKIEADKLQLDAHPFDLDELMRDLAVVLSGNQSNKAVELLFDIDPTLPSQLIGDRLRLQQILINLAGNALKFTAKGHVLVSIQSLQGSDPTARLRLSVKDTGIGISPEQATRIFEGFTQAEASTTRRYGGTGLGLAICKRLVEMMGGTLQLNSQPGQGCCFWFDISLPTPSATPATVSTPSWPPGLRALVAEDNALMRDILSTTLRTMGLDIDTASGGLAALNQIQQAQASAHPYHLVFMDWHMPDLDGISAAKRLQQTDPTHPLPVVIMITAHSKDMLSKLAADEIPPFVDMLTKPVTPQQLRQAIEQACQPHTRPVKAATIGSHEQRLRNMRILIVEDNPLNRQVASELLSYEGAVITLAEDGLSGVQKATADAADFDIILMDMQMPDIDGLEATRRIRAHPRGQRIPIAAMTANASQDDRQLCLAAGMNEHLAKPIHMERVVPTLLQLTGRTSTGQPLQSDSSVAPQALPSPTLIDPWELTLQRFGQQSQVYRSALSAFVVECHRLLDELERQTQTASTTPMAATLHTLKGLAATLGAGALARQAADLEQQVKTQGLPLRAGQDDASTLNELRTLAQSSIERLQACLPTSASEPSPQQQTVLPPQAWQERLRALQVLLQTGDLAALDAAGELLSATPAEHQSAMQTLHQHTQALAFEEALLALEPLLNGQNTA